ncbi:MAG: tetratricopeptide repeat protein, partial [Elusimicrobia bacterium]|nr:tetratricopeptide repeat protein [Elusimicrobiota bacterium]
KRSVAGAPAAQAQGRPAAARAADSPAASDTQPESVVYFERSGTAALAKGDYARAQAAFLNGLKAAAKLGSQDAVVGDTYWGLGQCLEKQKDRRRAIRAYGKALQTKVSPATRKLVEARLAALQSVETVFNLIELDAILDEGPGGKPAAPSRPSGPKAPGRTP